MKSKGSDQPKFKSASISQQKRLRDLIALREAPIIVGLCFVGKLTGCYRLDMLGKKMAGKRGVSFHLKMYH